MYVHFVYIRFVVLTKNKNKCKKYEIFKPLNIVVGKRNNIYFENKLLFFLFSTSCFFACCEGHVMRRIYFYKNVKTFYSVFRILLKHYK